MDGQHFDILIVGAGMAGLTCATALAEAGRSVAVLDKGRGPGGRMAARRTEIAGEVVSFDHGAQYFTARDPAFQKRLADWESHSFVAHWPAAGNDAWVGVPGMNGPVRAMAEPLDVRWNVRAQHIVRGDGIWHVEAGEETFCTSTVLVAIPAEQARELLQVSAPDFASIAASVQSEPCWAAMVAFDAPLEISGDAIRDPEAAISWAARNSAKPGRLAAECWVLHASPKRSREMLELAKDKVASLLLSDFFAQAGVPPVAPIHLAAHRWLYAMPGSVEGEPARYDAERCVGIAGDYLHSPRVEGAFLSGLALAGKVLGQP